MVTEREARAILSKYHDNLYYCVLRAWERWQASCDLAMPTARARANLVYDLMIDEARKRFGALHDVRLLEKNQQLLLIFDEKLLVRFKKFDRRLLTRNYPTEHATLFDAQAWLPDVPDHQRITVGYRLNEITQDEPQVLVVFSMGNEVIWFYEISEPAVATLYEFHPVEKEEDASKNAAQKKEQTEERRPRRVGPKTDGSSINKKESEP